MKVVGESGAVKRPSPGNIVVVKGLDVPESMMDSFLFVERVKEAEAGI